MSTQQIYALLLELSSRFAGFSLEKREEWRVKGRWRVRILPNKAERQDYRIEMHGDTIDSVLLAAKEQLDLIDVENRKPLPEPDPEVFRRTQELVNRLNGTI